MFEYLTDECRLSSKRRADASVSETISNTADATGSVDSMNYSLRIVLGRRRFASAQQLTDLQICKAKAGISNNGSGTELG